MLNVAGTVVLYRTIRPCNGEGIIQAVFFQARIVGVIIHLFITDLLDSHILGGVDAQASAVYGIIGLGLRISQLLAQILHDLFCQGIHEVTVWAFFAGCAVDRLDPGVYIVRHSFIILGLLNVSLLQHIFQNLVPAFLVVLRIGNRIVFCRILGNTCNNRTL